MKRNMVRPHLSPASRRRRLAGALAVLTLVLTTNTAMAITLVSSPQFVGSWGSVADPQLRYPRGMAVDGANNIYIADTVSRRIQKYTSSGAPIIRWGTQGSGDGQFSFPSDVAVDGSGNIFVADSSNRRIQKFILMSACPGGTTEVTPGVCFVTKWGTYGDSEGQVSDPMGIAVDGNGNVYVADSYNSRVQKFGGDGTFDRMWGWGVSDGSATFQVCTSGCQGGIWGSGDGQFKVPVGIASDASGNIYVADVEYERVQKFDSSGNFIAKWGTVGGGVGQFQAPMEIAMNGAGELFVADQNNNRIQKFQFADPCPAGTTPVVTGVCYVALVGGYGADDGKFNHPAGVAVDNSGSIYVGDTMNDRIQKFDSNFVFQSKWGYAGEGEFHNPAQAATDGSGNVYVADPGNQRIQKFTSGGSYVTQWGGLGNADGKFREPFGITVDSSGNVYVADANNQRIQKFTSDGSFLLKWGSQGTGIGQFYSPLGIAVDSGGYMYVSDQSNFKIQKFAFANPCPGGTTQVTPGVCHVTEWGGTPGGSGNGEFQSPGGIAVDAANNVYVTDQYNHRIQKFTSNGTYLTQWGSIGSGDGQFNVPAEVTVDSAGNVFVVDFYNNRVQKFTATGTFLDKWGSVGTGNGQFSSPMGIAIAGSYLFVTDSDNQRVQKFRMNGVFLPAIVK